MRTFLLLVASGRCASRSNAIGEDPASIIGTSETAMAPLSSGSARSPPRPRVVHRPHDGQTLARIGRGRNLRNVVANSGRAFRPTLARGLPRDAASQRRARHDRVSSAGPGGPGDPGRPRRGPGAHQAILEALSRLGCRRTRWIWALLAASVGAAPAVWAGTPLWSGAAQVAEARAVRLRGAAGALASDDEAAESREPARAARQVERLRQAEARLHEALELQPGDLGSALALADVQTMAGRLGAAIETLERALPRTVGAEHGVLSFRLAVARSRLGRHREAAAAYAGAVADGAGDSTIYTNLGEVLMADGRLSEAQARYRDAIAAAAVAGVGPGGPLASDRALAGPGARALWPGRRAGSGWPARAAREMMARALAHDPGVDGAEGRRRAGVRQRALLRPGRRRVLLPGAGLRGARATPPMPTTTFGRSWRGLPPAAGRRRRALTSPAGGRRDAGSTARARRPGRRPGFDGRRARIVAQGTVLASGPIPAPLVDAAWRGQRRTCSKGASRRPSGPGRDVECPFRHRARDRRGGAGHGRDGAGLPAASTR